MPKLPYRTCNNCGKGFKPTKAGQKRCYDCRNINASPYANSTCWYCPYLMNCRTWVKQWDKLLPCMPGSLLNDDWEALGIRYMAGGPLPKEIELRMMDYIGQEVMG